MMSAESNARLKKDTAFGSIKLKLMHSYGKRNNEM
jgi:hypothetical protein